VVWLGKLWGSKTLIFPRGGKLIEQTRNSKLMHRLLKAALKGADVFLSQGKIVSF